MRTKNWTAHWADKEKHAPGAFRLRIDGRDCDTLFGTGRSRMAIGRRAVRPTLRRASTKSRCTIWRDSTRVATPSSSRCTTWAPDDSLETVFRLRNNLLGLPAEPEERGTFDFVVAGGGVAGMCAAIAAARQGCAWR